MSSLEHDKLGTPVSYEIWNRNGPEGGEGSRKDEGARGANNLVFTPQPAVNPRASCRIPKASSSIDKQRCSYDKNDMFLN